MNTIRTPLKGNTVKVYLTRGQFDAVREMHKTGRPPKLARAKDITFALNHYWEFHPAITPGTFIESNQIEIIEGEKNE